MKTFICISENKCYVREATKQGYAVAHVGDSINIEHPGSKTRRGRIGTGVINTLTTSCNIAIVEDDSSSYKQGVKHMYKKVNKEIKLLDAFAGIGAIHSSLKRIGADVDLVGISEIDPDAIINYASIHCDSVKKHNKTDDYMRKYLMDRNIGWDFEKQKSSIPRMKKTKLQMLYDACIATNNIGDICIVDYDNIPDFDLFNFSFPCQNISNSGRQEGFVKEDGTLTKSGLAKFGIELIKNKEPKYIMIENVKALIQKKFIKDFNSILDELCSYGYNCYYPCKDDTDIPKCLNALNFDIPQNRERIFVICIREDVDNEDFEFPLGHPLSIKLMDMLEEDVDESFYLGQEKVDTLIENTKGVFDLTKLHIGTCHKDNDVTRSTRNLVYNDNNIMATLTATDYKDPKKILNTRDLKVSNNNDEIKIIYKDEEVDLPCIVASRGRNVDNPSDRTSGAKVVQMLEPNTKGVSNTLTTVEKDNYLLDACIDDTQQGFNGIRVYESKIPTIRAKRPGLKVINIDKSQVKIRKITPRESWRLMGFTDEEFDRAIATGCSNSQLYKQAGNSIVVNVLAAIFYNLFK